VPPPNTESSGTKELIEAHKSSREIPETAEERLKRAKEIA
jgi:hypothetical protein